MSNTGGRGRGGSVDRGGRIRSGRGGMFSSHYSRGVGFDDSGEGNRLDSQPYPGRNRPFDRSQSERGWSERNGIADTSDWNGSTSPRKELGRGTSGGSLMEGNWRRHRGAGDDEDGWRVTPNNRGEKWGRGSWRDGGGSDRDRLDRSEGDIDERNTGRWEARGLHRSSHDSAHHHHPTRTARTWESNHHDNHDNLPEWATENPSESGGSFDASGAFHGGMFSDEDEEGGVINTGGHEHRTRRVSEGTNNTNSRPGTKPIPYSNNTLNQSAHRQPNASSNSVPRERPKSLHPFEEKDVKVEQQERRSASPTKQQQPAVSNPSIKASPLINSAVKKNPTINTAKVSVESNRIQAPQRSKSFVELPSKNNHSHSRGQDPAILVKSNKLHVNPHEIVTNNLNTVQKPDDDLDRMKVEADMLVAKLMADEESHREEVVAPILPSVANHVQPINTPSNQEKWYYRDPQGEVQGPFMASEMAEWCKAGYFTQGLHVRRTCDERYATLGDLMKLYGRSPFIPGPPLPPLKMTEPVMSTIPSAVPAGLPGSALPKPGIKDPLTLLQYQQLRVMHNQQNLRNLLMTQMKASAIAKLSQSEHWNTLNAVEQNQLIMQCVVQDCELRDIPGNPFVAQPLAPPTSNSVIQLFSQMQQAKTQNENHLPPNLNQATPLHPGGSLDPIQQFIQQIGGIQNLPGPPQPSMNAPTAQPPQDDDPIKSLLRQLHVNANGHPQTHQIDSIWPQPPPQMNPQFNAQNWLAQVCPC